MLHHFRLAAAVLLFMALLACFGLAQTPLSAIGSGDADYVNLCVNLTEWGTGGPVVGAKVVLLDTGDWRTTDSKGRAYFRNGPHDDGYWLRVSRGLLDPDLHFLVIVDEGEPDEYFEHFEFASNLNLPMNTPPLCCEKGAIMVVPLRLHEPEFAIAAPPAAQICWFEWELESIEGLPCVLWPDGAGGGLYNPSLAEVGYPPDCSGIPSGATTYRDSYDRTENLAWRLEGETGRLLSLAGLKIGGRVGGGSTVSRSHDVEIELANSVRPGVSGVIAVRRRYHVARLVKIKVCFDYVNGIQRTPLGEERSLYWASGLCQDFSGLAPGSSG